MEHGENIYLILDSRNTPLAHGELLNGAQSPQLQIRVLEDGLSDVMRHEQLRLVPVAGDRMPLQGRVLDHRKEVIQVERLQTLDSELRQNLRMPTHFQSFIYPIIPGVTSSWRGREEIEANDLSCGGIAFFCNRYLKPHERVEVVVPTVSAPLLLRCEVLRKRPSNRRETLYAAKFVDMCDDEETLVREAVFNIQVRSRAKPVPSMGN